MLFCDIPPLLPLSGLKKFLNMEAPNSYEIWHFPTELHSVISNVDDYLLNYMVSHHRRANINIHYYENFKSHLSITYYRRTCRQNYNCKFSGGGTDGRIRVWSGVAGQIRGYNAMSAYCHTL